MYSSGKQKVHKAMVKVIRVTPVAFEKKKKKSWLLYCKNVGKKKGRLMGLERHEGFGVNYRFNELKTFSILLPWQKV